MKVGKMTQIRLLERPSGNPDVVKFLEEALVDAKSGELTGIVLIDQTRDGKVGYATAGVTDRYKVAGYLFHALHKLQAD